MKYNFDEIIPRRGTDSMKWDDSDDPELLPLWVADMDFRVAPCIREALQRRLDHGIFGYVRVPDAYYEAVINWFARRHGWTMQREEIIYTSGVLPAIAAILRAVTKPGDGVLMLTPIYNCFYASIRNAACRLVDVPLVYEEQTYRIDFEAFEQAIVQQQVKVFLLCNPHNPVGRVWTREELTRMGDLCLKHGVFVISDEIHCELMQPGFRYTPFASLCPEFARQSAICTSPTKNFNIAGLQIANITVADPDVRRRVDKAINIHETCDVNPFGVDALQAAYSADGEEWLNELLAYIHENYNLLCRFVAEQMPKLSVTRLEGTYLAWVDCAALGLESEELADKLRAQAHVRFAPGREYDVRSSSFLRVNLACPRGILQSSLAAFRAFYLELLPSL